MTITVLVAKALAAATDGRRRVDLGIPPDADFPHVLDTLLTLYPRLQSYLPTDLRAKPAGSLQLSLMFEPRTGGLRIGEGARLYLVAAEPRRLTDQAA